MSMSFVRDLLVHAIAAAKANERAEARRLLERVLGIVTDNQQKIEALYWLSEISDDPKEQRDCLEAILAMDMSDGRARRKLAILNGQIKPEEIIDPNLPRPSAVSDPQSAETKRFDCPQCGGRMVFSPDGQSLICEYCASKPKTAQYTEIAKEQDFFVALATGMGHNNLVAMRIFVCKGCGANYLLSPTQLSITCPYCASPHVVLHQDSKELVALTGIVPFAVNEIQAKVALKNWLVTNLKGEIVRVRKGRGVYIPVWTFDLAGAVAFRYRLQRKNSNRLIDMAGEDHIFHNDYLVPATKNLERVWQEQIQYYDLEKNVRFDESYLSDWPAETYQVPVSDASLSARQAIFEQEKEKITGEIRGRFVDLVITSERIRVDSYKLILLPLWISSFTHQERQYNVTINGQNGRVVGELPSRGLKKWIDTLLGES